MNTPKENMNKPMQPTPGSGAQDAGVPNAEAHGASFQSAASQPVMSQAAAPQPRKSTFPASYERACGMPSDHWLPASIIAAVLLIVGGGILQLLYLAFGIEANFDNLAKAADASGLSHQGFMFLMYFSFIGIWVMTLLWMLIRQKERPLYRFLRLNKKGNRIPWMLVGLMTGFAANALCILGAAALGSVELEYASPEYPWILLLFLAVLIQSGAEELVCRGYLFFKLRRRYKNPWVAILVNTALFTVLHFANGGINVWSVLDLIAVGILLSLLVHYFDSFWGAVFFHTGWNFTQNILFGLKNSGAEALYSVYRQTGESRDGFFYDSAFGVEGSPSSVMVIGLLIVVMLVYIRTKEIKPVDYWE